LSARLLLLMIIIILRRIIIIVFISLFFCFDGVGWSLFKKKKKYFRHRPFQEVPVVVTIAVVIVHPPCLCIALLLHSK